MIQLTPVPLVQQLELLASISQVLDETIREAEDWLLETVKATVEGEVPINAEDDTGDFIAWRMNTNRQWKLMYGIAAAAGQYEERPLLDVSRIRKVDALNALDRLVEEVSANATELLVKIDTAICRTKRLMGKDPQ